MYFCKILIFGLVAIILDIHDQGLTNLLYIRIIFLDVIDFLAVQNSSIGDLVTDSLTDSVTFDFDITE